MENQFLQAIKAQDLKKLRDVLTISNGNVPINKFYADLDGMSPLQFISYSGHPEILNLLLQQKNLNIDQQDQEGNTALHIACAASVQISVEILLAANANFHILNNFQKRPLDYADDPNIRALLSRLEVSTSQDVLNQNSSFLSDLFAVLPSDVGDLKTLVMEVISDFHTFQEKCKEVLFQLIEEKHIAYYKYSLLEGAAGIKDRNTGLNFLDQLAFLQEENEKQSANLNYYKTQSRLVQRQLEEQEEMFQQSISALMMSHNEELMSILKKNEEMDRIFQNYRDRISKDLEELATLKSENLSLRSKLKEKSAGPAEPTSREEKLIQSLQNESTAFDQRMKDIAAQKVAIAERLKTYEKMKMPPGEKPVQTQVSKEEAMSKIQEDRRNQDEKDANAGLIVFIHGEDGSARIKGGTVDKLVERLVDGTAYDSDYVSAFLLTYRSFMKKYDLFNALAKSLRVTDMDQSVTDSTMTNLHLRICNTIKQWISSHWYDFSEDTNLMNMLKSLVEEFKDINPRVSAIISFALNQKLSNKDDGKTDILRGKLSIPPPKPILPKSLMRKSEGGGASTITKGSKPLDPKAVEEALKIKFADIDPLEIARQLTLVEHKLFVNIRPTEFLDLAWMKDDKEKRAPGICAITKFSNHVVNWVISEIVSLKDNKARAAAFEKFIIVSKNLESLNNFNGVKEVLAALSSASVYRLKKTKEAVSTKLMKVLTELNKVTSNELNFKNLRAKVNAAEPPLIPFPGVYQGDLVFLDTCTKGTLEGGLINFQKHQKVASYIQELISSQRSSYNLESVPEISDYIKNYPVLDEETAYNLSLQCEPRQ